MMAISSCDHHKDFIRQALVYSLILLPVPVLLAFFYKANLFLALGLSVVFVVVANGVKSIVLSVMTFKMRKVMNAGAYSAISNAVASIAAGVTPTIIGKVIDGPGWAAAYWVTTIVCAVIIIALFIIDTIVRKDYKKAHKMQTSDKLD